ncbi:hypothetical protein GCM10023172_29930 [Hymenobacter ginsengisoli]|uniref:Uncharacterized protein n=1 Tax=Hymenobacter ginsengisoli TaxID=1051626 RepID=A0ABP8QLX7_9BACT
MYPNGTRKTKNKAQKGKKLGLHFSTILYYYSYNGWLIYYAPKLRPKLIKKQRRHQQASAKRLPSAWPLKIPQKCPHVTQDLRFRETLAVNVLSAAERKNGNS